MPETPPYGSYALAGQYAKAWFVRLEQALEELRRTYPESKYRDFCDEILDDALAMAGLSPRTSSTVESIAGYSMLHA